MHTLPPEVLSYIFQYLEMDHKLKAGLVCRYWQNILVSTPSLWQHIVFIPISNKPKEYYEKQLSTYQKYSNKTIKSITTAHAVFKSGFDDFVDDHFVEDGTTFPHLDSFFMKRVFDYHDVNLDSFLKKHLNLVTLRLDFHFIPTLLNLEDILATFPQLQYLQLSGIDPQLHPKSKSKERPVISHPLKTLTLEYYDIITNITSVLLDNLEKLYLEDLSISFLEYYQPNGLSSPEITNHITFPKLRSLELGGNNLPESQFEIHVPALVELILHGAYLREPIFDTIFKTIPWPKLKRLELLNCTFHAALLQKPSDLHELIIHQSILTSTLYANILFGMISKWTNFSFLELKQFFITDEFITQLEKAAPLLDTLILSRSHVRCTSILQLVQKRMSADSQPERKTNPIRRLELRECMFGNEETLDSNIELRTSKFGTDETFESNIEFLIENVPYFVFKQ